MSEKLDELLISVGEIKQNRRIDSMLMRGFIVACGAVMIYFITFMVQTSGRLSKIEATLVTTDNITKLRTTITDTKQEIHNKLGGYLSLNSYIAIESQRSITVADLMVMLGQKTNVREEELERFRSTAIFKLNNNIKLGTTRNQTLD